MQASLSTHKDDGEATQVPVTAAQEAHVQPGSPTSSTQEGKPVPSDEDATVQPTQRKPSRLFRVVVWAIRIVLAVEGAILVQSLARRAVPASDTYTSSEEPSDAVDKLVDYLAGRKGPEVLVPLESEELLAAGEELDSDDLSRLGYSASSQELRQLLQQVVEVKRQATAKAKEEAAAAAAAASPAAAEPAAGKAGKQQQGTKAAAAAQADAGGASSSAGASSGWRRALLGGRSRGGAGPGKGSAAAGGPGDAQDRA